MKQEIKHRYTGEVLYSGEHASLIDAVIAALTVGAKAPVFVPNELDTPAPAWSEFYYWVFSYLPLP